MINGYIGSASAGLYSIGYAIAMPLNLVIGALLAAWTPDYFEDMGNRNYKKLDSDVDKMFRLILIGAIFLMFFGQEMGKIVADEKYYDGLKIVPIVSFGYIFAALWQFWGRNIGYAKKNIWNSIIAFSSGFTNIGLNIVLIPRYGYVAAAYTTVVSYIVMAFMGWAVSKWILKLRITPMTITLKPVGVLLLFCGLVFGLESMSFGFWPMVGIKTLLFVTFIFFMILRYAHSAIAYLRPFLPQLRIWSGIDHR